MITRAKHQDNGSGRPVNRHAVVLGGSLAGLLAARVLSDYFERVTLIERDVYPDTPETRRGIPQANHVHALLLRGRLILEELFPGLQDEMVAEGAPELDMANDVGWFTRAGFGVRFQSNFKVLAFTRPMLDLHVRRHLARNPRVEILDNTDVLSLLADTAQNRVRGVLVSQRNAQADRTVARELHADLVIDATGRASRAPRWLTELGYDAPEEIVVDAQLGYASRFYRIPANFNGEYQNIFVQAAPPERNRGGFLMRVEGNRWLLTLIGGGGDHPPSDDAGFLEFARSLPISAIYDAVRLAEPLSPIKTHRGTQNRLRRFDRAKRLPDNFLLLGDAVCAFNPVYGQGMTIAALGALTLQQCLQEQQRFDANADFRGLSRRFQKRLAKVNKTPWMLATGEDYRYRDVAGGSPNAMNSFMHWYVDHVVELATQSVAVRSVLLRAFSMLAPPTVLFRPGILFRVAGKVLRLAPRQNKSPVVKRPNQQMLYHAEARD